MKKRLLITCLMSLIVIGVWAEKNENEPVIILTTSNERTIGFSLGATEDNTSIQIDWGDGNLVNKVINSAKTSIQGTPAGTKNIKI